MLSTGQLDRCLVGGIDSCIEPLPLVAAAAKGVLKTSINPVGFVAGEAAAFILLERAADIHGQATPPLGFLTGASFVSPASDRLSENPPDGIALAQALVQALPASRPSTPLAFIMSDLNGDDYRARDWGSALIRLRGKHNLADVPTFIPAVAFGEIGAASVPVGLCVGIVGQRRGWIPRGSIVEWSSADKGSRAALCFESRNVTHPESNHGM